MRKYLRSRSILEVTLEEPEPSEEVVPVAAQQPSDEQAQQEAPPTESQDVTLDQDNEDERAPEVPDADLEAKFQELALHKTGPEDKVKGASLPKLQFVQLPTAGPYPETGCQDLTPPNTGEEGSNGPDSMEDVLPNLESIYMPKAVVEDIASLARIGIIITLFLVEADGSPAFGWPLMPALCSSHQLQPAYTVCRPLTVAYGSALQQALELYHARDSQQPSSKWSCCTPS